MGDHIRGSDSGVTPLTRFVQPLRPTRMPLLGGFVFFLLLVLFPPTDLRPTIAVPIFQPIYWVFEIHMSAGIRPPPALLHDLLKLAMSELSPEDTVQPGLISRSASIRLKS